MMDKFLALAKKMAGDLSSVENLLSTDDESEIYFTYKGVVFSLLKREESVDSWGRYSLYMYPKAKGVREVVIAFKSDPDPRIPLVALHERQLPTVEATLLRDLYDRLVRKDLGVDDIFTRLLGD